MQLSIIIVSYNVRYFLEQCLYSVQAAISNMEAEVIVVDNNSTDDSLAYLQPAFPWVIWIANATNNGFGAANNQAVTAAKGEFILFLNPDTLVPEDCFQQCISFIQSHPETGALGIKMLDGSGQYLPESKRGFPSLLTSFFKLSGLAVRFPHSRVFARYHLGHLSKNENHLIDVLAGAFMLVRRSVLQQTGAFDERFFMYGEDIDLSYRIRQAGWQNWYFAESTIIHFKGESTKKGSLNYVRMFYQAMYLFVQKHYTGRSAWLYRRIIQAAIGAKAGASVFATSVTRLTGSLFTKKKKKTLTRLLIIATNDNYEQVKKLLYRNGYPSALPLHSRETNDASQIVSAIKKYLPEQTIFCVDELTSMKTAIEVIEQLSGGKFGFHFSQSRSIISSSSKNSSGEWMAD